ncbi:MAG: hypothetical protein ACTH0V_00295 [Microbacteriaceae bacterium]
MFAEVEVYGRRARWEDGVFSGDPDIARFAASAAEVGVTVPVAGQTVTADASTPLGAAAAMLAFSAGAAGYIVDGTTGAFDALDPAPEGEAAARR